MKVLLLLLGLFFSMHTYSQLKTRSFTISEVDTIYLAVNNKFSIEPSISIQQQDRQYGRATIKDGLLNIIPVRPGKFQLEYYWEDKKQKIVKQYFSMALPYGKVN